MRLDVFQKFLTRLSPREKVIFYIASFFLGLTIFKFVIIEPIFLKTESIDKQIKEKKVILKKDLHLLSLKKFISQERDRYSSYFSKKMSKEKATTQFLKEIEKLAKQAGVYLVYIRPGSVEEKDFFQKHTINLRCEGNMYQLVSFFYSLESAPKLFTIEKYTLSPKPLGSEVLQCRMTVLAMLVYR